MSANLPNHSSPQERSSALYPVNAGARHAILWTPVVTALCSALLLAVPSTRAGALWMLKENHPVELLTFAFALLAGVLGLRLVFRLRKEEGEPWVFGFYAVFSSALIFVGMEEVAWGQKFLGFETPSAWQAINRQGETTLHNVWLLQGRTEFLRLIYGLGGMIGVMLSNDYRFWKIGAPSVLVPWFVIICLHSALDAYNDYFPIEADFDNLVNQASEMTELFIVTSGLLYIILNSRRLSKRSEQHAL
ncbi:MAG: hypothetical protein ACU841_11360 [Gammaproteobacteria bacterium]